MSTDESTPGMDANANVQAEVERLQGMLDRTEALIHGDDGFISEVVDQQARISDLEGEIATLRAVVDEVRALRDEWDEYDDAFELWSRLRSALPPDAATSGGQS